jgi:glutamine amidotransferase
MCLLTLIPDYVSPDMDRFKIAAQSNPDGFGFAISTGKKLHIVRSMNFEEVANKFVDARKTMQGPAIFHFRWTTHGTNTVDNCHPFLLGQDSQTVMGHNGILPVKMDKDEKRSDTRVFAEDIMPAIGGVSSLDDGEYFNQMAEWAKGSKLAFLTVNDDAKYDWYIVNEKDGHWDSDIWWSNSSYKQAPIRYASYTGMYGAGFSDWDYGYESTRYSSSWTGSKLVDDYDDEASLVSHTPTFGECIEIAELYTDPVSTTHNKVTCYLCESQEIVPADEIRTHCGICSACLFCQCDSCNCWDALWEEPEMPTTNYGFNIPSGTNTHPSYY